MIQLELKPRISTPHFSSPLCIHLMDGVKSYMTRRDQGMAKLSCTGSLSASEATSMTKRALSTNGVS